MTRLSTLLDEIDSGVVLLPEFQRGYVWNRDQVRGLMRSLYRGYPVGGLLMWETTSEDITVRGAAGGSGTRQLLLDGQQRVTSMYGVVRGTPPPLLRGRQDCVHRIALQCRYRIVRVSRPEQDVRRPNVGERH